MSDLHALQENFQRYILEDDPLIMTQIEGLERMTSKERADCYKIAYELRLIEVTEQDFPYLRKYMGAEAFSALSKAYIKTYPSNHFNIVFFDRFFNKFLETYPGIEQVHRDLARFEWEMSTTLVAPDAPQLCIDDLAAIPPEHWGNIRVTFHPTVRLFPIHTNAPAIWTAYENKADTIPEVMTLPAPETWIMWRYNQLAYFIALNEHREWMFHAMKEGKSFGEVCETLMETVGDEEAAAQLAGMSLRDWFLEGALTSMSV